MKRRIEGWLARYKLRVSGTVALQEFKRRVLRDIAYLLGKLHQNGSYLRTLEYVTNRLTIHLQRKQKICLPLLHKILPGSSDDELTERARLYLRTLLMYGERLFLRNLDALLQGVNCYWARAPIREKKRYIAYEMGDVRCSKSRGLCQVDKALGGKTETCQGLLQFLKALPSSRLTDELRAAIGFLEKVATEKGASLVRDEDPCLKFGDLLLALESEGVPDFYTMNYKESQAYCDFLAQNLAVRPSNPDIDEQSYLHSERPWPDLHSRR